MDRNECLALVGVMLIVFGSFIAFDYTSKQKAIALKQIQLTRDKANQELVVQKIREERLLLEAKNKQLELTGSFITKEGIVYDQQIDPVN
jgi:cell division protein FtsB